MLLTKTSLLIASTLTLTETKKITPNYNISTIFTRIDPSSFRRSLYPILYSLVESSHTVSGRAYSARIAGNFIATRVTRAWKEAGRAILAVLVDPLTMILGEAVPPFPAARS